MSKLLKYWKVLSLGAVVTAMGLFMASCVEDPPEDETKYSVSIGTWEIVDMSEEGIDTLKGVTGTSGTGKYAKGETVTIKAGTKPGYVFIGWTSDEESNVFGVDEDGDPEVNTRKTATFVMPGKNVRITAWYYESDVEGYTVTVIGGDADNEYNEEGDIVTISANISKDSLFVKWVTDTSVVKFINGTTIKSEVAKFRMPAEDVSVTAVFAPKPDMYQTAVRFTWYMVDEPNIESIIADKASVDSWKTNVFLDEDFVEEDASEVPTYSGIPGIPAEIFPTYKSKYFAVPLDDKGKGFYTAVCTVYDPEYDDFTYIVANYEVTPTGKQEENIFFEIGFDVGTYLADEGKPWIKEDRDNPQTDPRLEKRKVKKLVKTFKNGNVTYYILHKAKK